MRYAMLCLLLILFLPGVALTQADSCLDIYRSFSEIKPEVQPTPINQNYTISYGSVMSWYTNSRCVLLGSGTGLWLYDIDQPDNPLQLASISGSAINNVAVNSIDSTIAFSVGEQSLVYLLHVDGVTTTIQADGQAVTGIAFLDKENWIAVASSDIGYMGFRYDARVQILDLKDQQQLAFMTSDTGQITEMFFSSDYSHLLTDGALWGYIGNDVEYWNISPIERIWDYAELFWSIEHWSVNDPLIVFTTAMKGRNIAFGGLDGYMDYDDYYGHAIHVWDVERLERRFEIILSRRGSEIAEAGGNDLTFNADGSVLVSSSSNGIIQFWEMTGGSEINKFEIGQHKVDQIALSPNDRFLAILSDDEMLIWDVEKQAEYATFPA